MCTLLILRHVHPEWPVVLAANRDELQARPATGPQVLSHSPRIVGGRDLERLGTWMGVTDGGFFVGLTNQRGALATEAALRSRGEVVMHALEAGSPQAVEPLLEGLNPAEFHPFNLLYGNAEVLRVAYARPEAGRILREDVPPGIHVLPNDVLDSAALPKVQRARELAEAVAQRPCAELVQALQALLADHALPELDQVPASPPGAPYPPELARHLQALCIHVPGYGTRSSAIVALTRGRVAHYLASDTPPCQGPFRDVTPLLYPR